ncbi:eukaryotic translation initiation factor 4E transporter-like isoform X2 [Haliotis cracherodii]|uniref:eukaryotic translation initiation factor 4E transporter-like isoform X2 n=1 Tax=Haliotis cracherodii TaxID=6455 RepID=UPI0039E7A276
MDKGKPRSGSGDEDDVIEQAPVRADTPGPLPQFQYAREKLMELAETFGARLRPKCLLKTFDNADGLWDPEKWSRSFGGYSTGSRENSPLTIDPRDRKKQIDLDREQLMRRRTSDPRERLKEERDGIVLSPQRRSFGTGCHVTQTSSLGRQVSCPADFKDGADRDRDRRERRIGSGRITIDRDQGREREYRGVRDRYDRDDRRGSGNPTDRTFERSDRYHSSSYDNNRSNYNRFSRDNRGNRRGRYVEEEEPEWFSAGPTSQSDTIELRGFEKEPEEDTGHGEGLIIEEEECGDEAPAESNDKTGISVGDRNGSLETNESSSPEVNHETRPSPSNSALFDFNDFFKVNSSLLMDEQTVEPDVNVQGSRFQQWFQQQQQQQLVHGHSKDNSRRSSINEEFNYLNDIIDGSRSPVIPSPPPAPAHIYDGKPGNFYQQYAMTMEEKQAHLEAMNQRKNSPNNPLLNALFMNSGHMDKSNTPVNSGNFSTQDAEAQLKAMLFRGRDSNSSSGTASPAVMGGASRKVKTLAELEADFHQGSPTHHMSPIQHQNHQQHQHQQQQQPPQPHQHQQHPQQHLQQHHPQHPQQHPQQHPPQHVQQHPQQHPQQVQQHPQHHPQQVQQHPQHVQQHPQHIQQHPQHVQQHHPQHTSQHTPQQHPQHDHHHHQHQHQHQSPQETKTGDDGDLTAFNKLLSMMQAGAAAAVGQHLLQQQQQQQQAPPPPPQEPPKHVQMGGQMMMTPDGRSMSPLQQQLHNLQLHNNNNDFLQVRRAAALMRNKEQQLHIQQQTLQQMQRQPPPQPPPTHTQPQQPPQPMIPPPQPQTPRAITQDPILNFIQQNPTIITKPPSPSPTIPTLMANPSTPRVVSPAPQSLPPNLLPKQVQTPQQISGAKIPSPIMFSQQPPMHLSAPSPIHPAQLARSLASHPLTANTLTTASANIRPQSVARVPSPQELIAHTQAIMQSALIKKQLEDQKERFLKKQQERARSPNQNRANPSPMPTTPTAANQGKSTMSAAFTPTSVIRKMHSDRASEKEKSTKDIDHDDLDGNPPDGANDSHSSDKYHSEKRARQDAEDIASLPGIDFNAEPNQPITSLEEKLKLAGISGQSGNKSTPILGQGDKSSRPVVGQGMMQGGVPIQVQTVANSTPVPGRPIVKVLPQTPASTPSQFRPLTGGPGAASTPVRPADGGQRAIVGSSNLAALDMAKVLEQQQRIQQQQSAAAAAAAAARQVVNTPLAGRPVGVGSNAPFGIPITGRMPVQSNVAPPNVHAAGAANALLMQQMMQQSTAAAARGLNLGPLSQINQLNQLAAIQQAQQAQQRMVDPRLQGVRYPGIVPQMMNPRSTAGTNMGLGVTGNPAINAVLGRALSPQILPGGGQKLSVNGPLSPNLSCTSPAQFINSQAALNGNNNITKTSTASDPNILKWFSSDVLKNHMPTMPPLPTQGQKVLTLDDLEGT